MVPLNKIVIYLIKNMGYKIKHIYQIGGFFFQISWICESVSRLNSPYLSRSAISLLKTKDNHHGQNWYVGNDIFLFWRDLRSREIISKFIHVSTFHHNVK